MSNKLIAEYDVILDAKKRIVIRGLPKNVAKHFHVKMSRAHNGCVTLNMEPRFLVTLDKLSKKALRTFT